MANCTISSGKTLGCRDNTGGNSVIDFSTFAEHTYDYSGDIITGTTSGSPVQFYRVEHDIEKIQINENPVTGDNMAAWYETTIMIELKNKGSKNLDDEIRSFRKKMVEGRWLISAEDNNGHRRLYGIEKGFRVSEGAGGMGKEFSAVNGMVLTLVAKQKDRAPLVTSGGAVEFVYNT